MEGMMLMEDEKKRLGFAQFVDWAFLAMVAGLLSYSASAVKESLSELTAGVSQLTRSVSSLEASVGIIAERVSRAEKDRDDHEKRLRSLERARARSLRDGPEDE